MAPSPRWLHQLVKVPPVGRRDEQASQKQPSYVEAQTWTNSPQNYTKRMVCGYLVYCWSEGISWYLALLNVFMSGHQKHVLPVASVSLCFVVGLVPAGGTARGPNRGPGVELAGMEDVFMFEPNGQKGFLFHHTSQQFHENFIWIHLVSFDLLSSII